MLTITFGGIATGFCIGVFICAIAFYYFIGRTYNNPPIRETYEYDEFLPSAFTNEN